MKKCQDRDKKALEEKNHDTNRDNKTIKKSKEGHSAPKLSLGNA